MCNKMNVKGLPTHKGFNYTKLYCEVIRLSQSINTMVLDQILIKSSIP
jgi:hypothetical protein